MMDHEKHGKLQVLDVFEDELDKIQLPIVVEQELGLPLDNTSTLLEEVHDSTTLESTYVKNFTLLRQMHNPTPMETSYDETFTLSDYLRELVHYPTSYPYISCSIHSK